MRHVSRPWYALYVVVYRLLYYFVYFMLNRIGASIVVLQFNKTKVIRRVLRGNQIENVYLNMKYILWNGKGRGKALVVTAL